MFAFSDGDARRHLGQLLPALDRVDVDELEQLEAVQLPLRLLELTKSEQLARLVSKHPPDDVVAHAGVAGDLDGSVDRRQILARPRKR